MSKIILTVGLPASGKSTWAKEQIKGAKTNTVRVSRDDLRQMLFNDICLDKREKFITAAEQMLVSAAFLENKNIIIDATHLSEKYQNGWKEFAAARGMQFELKSFLDVPVSECILRDSNRSVGRVGRAVIEGMALNAGMHEFPFAEYVVYDMDGTLADISWRGPFEYGKVAQDPIRAHVRDMLIEDYDAGRGIIILSGRSIQDAGISTEEWLASFDIPYHHLFMRRAKDFRKDTEIKREFMEKLPTEKIIRIVDDRPCVLRLWHEMFTETNTEIVDVGLGIEF